MHRTTLRGQIAARTRNPGRRRQRWRCALALMALLAGPAAAQDDIVSVVGQPVLALAQRPELTTGLRFNSGGHRSALAARLRDPGPPVALVAERFLQGWACRPSGCRDGGVFLAYDRSDERIYLMLTDYGAVRLSVPPDPRGWPEELRAGVHDFVPALAAAMGTR
ncbi:hypothetical protein GCM10011320_44720 [Neoroseomonas lacus]|uniref:Uncharacterized protein n=2 Tax=Neoroseomonas lacus TaxID=287609 RepID=A0A917NUV8_9PROT|nr:hypothetical protein GCM10011320_44720 [Neoroseomonas lacus]